MAIKTSINFGLVYIPVALHPAVKNNDIAFNLIDKETGSRIRYKRFAEESGREVSQSDIVKGYKYSDDNYVLFTDKDFERVKSERDKSVTIERFVPLSDIDPVYYDKAYYALPDKGAERAYNLLHEALLQGKGVGLARCVLGSRECLVAMRAKDGLLVLSTMYFDEEVRPAPAVKQTELSESEVGLALAIIESMSGSFEPENYRDEYRERLMSAIEAKAEGGRIESPEKAPVHKVTDLMEALRLSLEQQQASPVSNKGNKLVKPAAPKKSAPKKQSAAKPKGNAAAKPARPRAAGGAKPSASPASAKRAAANKA